MVTTERPCCGQPLIVDTPIPDTLRCEDCAVAWIVTDPEPALATRDAVAA